MNRSAVVVRRLLPGHQVRTVELVEEHPRRLESVLVGAWTKEHTAPAVWMKENLYIYI